MRPRGELPTLEFVITLLLMVAFFASLVALLMYFRTPVENSVAEYESLSERIIDLFGY